MISKTNIAIASVSALLVISISLSPAFAAYYSDRADINPHCKNKSSPDLYVSGTITASDDRVFFSWTADPSFYKYTGWWGSCNGYVEFDSISVKLINPQINGWEQNVYLGNSPTGSKTVYLNNDIVNGECMIFSYDLKYDGQSVTVYPNNQLNCA